MYAVLAPLVGALATAANVVNSQLTGRINPLLAIVVIHVVGLVAVSAILAAARPKPGSAERLPLYLYAAGVIGVGTVFTSTAAFSALGASLAVALALIGQTVFSVAADATGFLGRPLHALTPRRAPGIGLAVIGAAVMAENWRVEAFPMLLAFTSGVLPGLSSVLNAELARKKGLLRSTWMNYVTGLSTILVVAAVARAPFATLRTVASIPPLLLTGGLMGVGVVAGMSLTFSRLSAFTATLLVSAGQVAAGLASDAVTRGAFDMRKLVGMLVLLAGLTLDTLLCTPRRKAAGVVH
ncbi:MAG TPA: DMT family transporter [Spirochaetia bacterium]|nr:DMT family transporter [Spirochaetia bacterium]